MGKYPLWTILMGLLAAPAAGAQVLVVHEAQDLDWLRGRLEAANVQDAQLEHLSQVMVSAVPQLTGGTISWCDTTSSMAQFKEAYKRANSAVTYQEYETGRKHLINAENAMRCADGRIRSKDGARVFFLRGVVEFTLGETEAAKVAFTRAHLFSPGLMWDAEIPNDGEELFKEAETAIYMEPPSRLYLKPDPGFAWWVDGETPENNDGFFVIPAGTHHIQAGWSTLATYEVELQSGEGELLLPVVANPRTAWADDPEKRNDLERWLATSLDDGMTIMVATDRHLWQTTVGEWQWVDRWAAVLDDSARARKRILAGWATAGTGAAIATGGAVVTMMVYTRGIVAANEANGATNQASRDTLETEYEKHQKALFIGYAITAVGLGAIGAGILTTQLGDSPLRPDLVSASPGIRLTLGVKR
ncbi:MAG: hypothetical protein HN348_00280 [Proteobacteria bacterium]|nr:hypothetical protein [Pseudomonadota bacterium]